MTINGFLKLQCSVYYRGFAVDVFKCPAEDGYYQAIDLEVSQDQQVYTKLCQNDTYQYQVCGVIAEPSRRKDGDYFLCSYHTCQDERKKGSYAYSKYKYSSGGVLDLFTRCNNKTECAGGVDEIKCKGLIQISTTHAKRSIQRY